MIINNINRFLDSKEMVLNCIGGRVKQKLGFIEGVDKG